MISWEEYIKTNILNFREDFERFWVHPAWELIEKYKKLFYYSLKKPCQVVVIDFAEPYPKCFIILHNEEHPDKEIIALKNMAFVDFSSKVLKEIKLLESLDIGEIQRITEYIQKIAPSRLETDWVIDWEFFGRSSVILFRGDTHAYEFSDWLQSALRLEMDEILREEQREKIEETVGIIKRDAEAIPVEELRTKIVEATKRLETQIEPLYEKYKKLESDLVGVRRLVGTKGFGEWKVLLSEIDKVNTRIDSLSEIREAYDKVLAQQTKVIEQQSSFIKWIKYATILLPIAVISVPVIEVISILIRYLLSIP